MKIGETITWCHELNFPKDVDQVRGGIVPSAFQQTAWPNRKRSLVTAMRILPAKKFLLTLLACQTKGKFSGKMTQGRTIRAAKRRREDALASPTTPVAKDADQAEYVASACSLGASHTHSSRSIRIRVGTTLVARSCAWSD